MELCGRMFLGVWGMKISLEFELLESVEYLVLRLPVLIIPAVSAQGFLLEVSFLDGFVIGTLSLRSSVVRVDGWILWRRADMANDG